ncbi:MAG: hypothetical protein VZR53_08830 [Prevotella sp.]|nr:hypothetical protein [Prevotella sp.]
MRRFIHKAIVENEEGRWFLFEKVTHKSPIWITEIGDPYFYTWSKLEKTKRYDDIFHAVKYNPHIKLELIEFWTEDQEFKNDDLDFPNSSLQ